MEPYRQSVEEVLQAFDTDPTRGLSSAQVRQGHQQYGKNEIKETRAKSVVRIIGEQLTNVLTVLLLIAAVLSVSTGHIADAVVIVVAVVINVVIGAVQEYKADRELLSLRTASTASVIVLRESRKQKIDGRQLVPGDIVRIEQGQKIPADMRIIEQQRITVNESVLTGESSAIAKHAAVLDHELVIGDQGNMLFTGTTVMSGAGTAVVVRTGYDTELGKIVDDVQATPEVATPLQKQIRRLTWWLGGAALVIVSVVMLLELLRSTSVVESIPLAVSLAVAAVPEGLATSVFVVLTFGMRRMLKKKALTQKLVAAETLGSVNVLCVDKTGTLTKGQMQVQQLLTENTRIERAEDEFEKATSSISAEVQQLLLSASLVNDAFCVKKGSTLECVGDETEQAIARTVQKHSIIDDGVLERYARIDTIPFDSETKYMATLNTQQDEHDRIIAMKGAPEVVLQYCRSVFDESGVRELNSAIVEKWTRETERLSKQGLRVLAVAKRSIHGATTTLDEKHLTAMTFIGLIGFEDPVRGGAHKTIAEARTAGVRTVIVTGDHKQIAINIGKQVGVATAPAAVITGDELRKLSSSELRARIDDLSIFARISPRDKTRIIETLQGKGHTVGMTGDGVNDAPALHAADIGIAVASGTDAAKEASDIVLLDNNIRTIIDAIREGRRAYSNIVKVVRYLVSDSFTEIAITIAALAVGIPVPLTALHILWINIVSDSILGAALAAEPEESKSMQLPPRKKEAPLLNGYTKSTIATITLISGVAAFGIFWWALSTTNDLVYARTMAFTVLAIDSTVYVLSIRSTTESLFRVNPFKNKWLTGGMIATVLLQLAALYIPPVQKFLGTTPLSITDWTIVGAVAATVLFSIEAVKMFYIASKKSKLRS